MGELTEGFYAMHRGWQFDRDFEDDPFSRRDAWVWLIENAAHKDSEIMVGKKPCILQAGQLMHSVRYLADQWKWPLTRTQRLLDQFQKSGKITRSKYLHVKRVSETRSKSAENRDFETLFETPYNVITICNYVKYQAVSKNSGTRSETPQKSPENRPSETGFWNKDNKDDKIYTKPSSETSRSEALFLEIVHKAGFSNLPNDRRLVEQWIDKGASDTEIIEAVVSFSNRLLQQTGRRPFTLKVCNDAVQEVIHHNEQRRIGNERAKQERERSEQYYAQREATAKRALPKSELRRIWADMQNGSVQ